MKHVWEVATDQSLGTETYECQECGKVVELTYPTEERLLDVEDCPGEEVWEDGK